MGIYVGEDELVREVIISKGKGKITKELERMFLLMMNNINDYLKWKFNFHTDDGLSRACYCLYKYWNKYDLTKDTKCFAYYTQVINMGWLQGYYSITRGRQYKLDNGEKASLIYFPEMINR